MSLSISLYFLVNANLGINDVKANARARESVKRFINSAEKVGRRGGVTVDFSENADSICNFRQNCISESALFVFTRVVTGTKGGGGK